MDAVIWRRSVELLGIVAAGDAAVGLAFPQRHTALWSGGPSWFRRLAAPLMSRPGLVRLLSLAELAAGLWIAHSQYRDKPGHGPSGSDVV